MTAKKRTAPEIIGFLYGWDMRDVSEMRYQPTRYSAPGVYTIGDSYVCAPSGSQKPPKGWDWQIAGESYGRTVYSARAT